MDDDPWKYFLSELQALHDGAIKATNKKDLNLWTSGSVESRQYALDKRAELLDRALLLHTQDQDQLAIIRTRLQNASRYVSRLPDDVLIIVFEMAITHDNVNPESLASVCYRWKDVISGPTGAKLWSKVDVNVKSRSVAVDLGKRLSRFIERSRSAPLTVLLRGADGVTPTDVHLIRVVPELSFHRVHSLEVDNFKLFSSWFPLPPSFTSLHHVALKGSHLQDVSQSGQEPFLTSPLPSLQRFELLPDSPLASTEVLVVLRNISTFASITHLNIRVNNETSNIDTCLSSFGQLEYLRWRTFDGAIISDPPIAANGAQAISLPKLKTLSLGSTAAPVLSALVAPLVRVLHLGEPAAGPEDWGLIHPVRFPDLRKMTLIHPSWTVWYDVDALFDHDELEVATWVLHASNIADLLRCISLRMRPLSKQMRLRWLTIVCPAPFPVGEHPSNDGRDAGIAWELESLFIYRDTLPKSDRPTFKVRLSHNIVNNSTILARLVANHPDIEAGDVDGSAPGFDEVEE